MIEWTIVKQFQEPGGFTEEWLDIIKTRQSFQQREIDGGFFSFIESNRVLEISLNFENYLKKLEFST